MRVFDHCPGASGIRTPTLEIRKCPQCCEEVEIFSNDLKVTCGRCGFVIYNDIQGCIQWCRYAEQCVGPELYRKLRGGPGTANR
jgi:ribosomal protein S27AE